MATVHEVLKASGLTDEQIASLDTKIVTGLKTTLESAENEKKIGQEAFAKAEAEKTAAAAELVKAQQQYDEAQKARERAEQEYQSNRTFYEEKITPALTGWEAEKKALEIAKANAEAKSAFYETQIAGAKSAGFLPTDAPPFVLPNNPNPAPPQRTPDGRYVAGSPSSTPGSPALMTPEQMAAQAGNALSMIADVQFDYQRLYGAPMPILPSQLVAEAEKFHMDPKTFAEKQFKFSEKRQEIADKARAEEHARIAADAIKPLQEQFETEKKTIREQAEKEKRDLLERYGSNPDMRVAQPSRFGDLQRAVKANERPDPLNVNAEQRRAMTRNAIHQEIAESTT
jgi:hypothetical protein